MESPRQPSPNRLQLRRFGEFRAGFRRFIAKTSAWKQAQPSTAKGGPLWLVLGARFGRNMRRECHDFDASFVSKVQLRDKEHLAMQYVMLIVQGSTPLPGTPEWEKLSEDEQKQVYADYGAINSDPRVTPGLPLGLPENATTVRVENGKTIATDGPFVATKEALGGYFILEAENLDEAIEIAAQVPAARLGGVVEVRPVEAYWEKK